MSICAWIIAFLVGSFFGILRTVPNRFLSGLGTLYVELFRMVLIAAVCYVLSTTAIMGMIPNAALRVSASPSVRHHRMAKLGVRQKSLPVALFFSDHRVHVR